MVTTGGVPSEPQWGYALGMERWHPLRVAACMAVCVAFGVRAAVAEPGSDDAPSHRENDAPPVDDGPTVDPAYDQDRLQSGRLLFWKGYEQFKSGNFAEAVKTFEQVYALMPEPEILYNIALAHAKNGDCSASERAFSKYSRVVAGEQKLQQATLSFAKVLARCTEQSGQKGANELGEIEAPRDESTKREPVKVKAVSPRKAVQARAAPSVEHQHPAVSPNQAVTDSPSYWTLPRAMGWSFIASGVIASGAALYFVSRQRGAANDAEALKRQAEQTNEPTNAGDQIAELQGESDRFVLGASLSAIAAVGFAATGAALLVTERNEGPTGRARLADNAQLFLMVSGEF